MFEKKPIVGEALWTGTQNRRGKGRRIWRGALGVSLAAFVLIFSAGTVSAQFDPDELEDMVAFMSLAVYAGQPTLVVAAGYEQIALDQHGAFPAGGPKFATDFFGERLLFELEVVSNLQELLPVICPDGSEDPACRDIPSITYDNRACYQEAGVSVYVDCERVTDPNHPQFGNYVVKWDTEKNRCRLSSPGSTCTEKRVVGWHYQYYFDAGCSQEIMGTHVEVPGLRCAL